MQKDPLVSIIMPAFNAGDFLRPAIESILNQTYKNFELIIVDDASTDETSNTLKDYAKIDNRIKVITNNCNLGISNSANKGIIRAKGEFIARMDADDIAIPTRIEKQVSFLIRNNNVVAVGGQCQLIDKKGFKIGKKMFPTDFKNIKKMIFANIPLQQPTLMVNKELLPKNFVWYNNDFSSAEEMELIFRLFRFGEVRNLKDIVLKYRLHDKNTSFINPKKTFYLTLKTRIKAVLKYGYIPTFNGLLTTFAQLIFISIVPNSWIYPTYMYVRGIKKIDFRNVRIKLYENIPFRKAYELAQN
jgi:glycosyltransferase involved in cell wall biosynthesis